MDIKVVSHDRCALRICRLVGNVCVERTLILQMNDSAVAEVDRVPDTVRIVSRASIVAAKIRATLLATWRTCAVTFFSCCALVEIALTIPFFAPAKRLRARAEWLHRWSAFAGWVIGIRYATRGSPPYSGLLVCNHLSYLDIIVLSTIRPCIFVAKRDIAAWPLFGWLTRAAGAIFVDRERRLDAGDVVAQMKEAIQAGVLVVLFPEGTSSDGATVLPFKPSLLEPAAQLDCEITAARIRYSLSQGSVADEICYWRDMTLVSHLFNVFTKPRIYAQVAFAPFVVGSHDRKQIARELHRQILSMSS